MPKQPMPLKIKLLVLMFFVVFISFIAERTLRTPTIANAIEPLQWRVVLCDGTQMENRLNELENEGYEIVEMRHEYHQIDLSGKVAMRKLQREQAFGFVNMDFFTSPSLKILTQWTIVAKRRK